MSGSTTEVSSPSRKRQRCSIEQESTPDKASSASASMPAAVNVYDHIGYQLEVTFEVFAGEGAENPVTYAVFETARVTVDNQYFIYKIDVPKVDFRPCTSPILRPIHVVKFTSEEKTTTPFKMIVFSSGSKIYFCGGFNLVYPPDLDLDKEYLTETYVFDTRCSYMTQIQSMKSPKPRPHVLGPLDHMIYIFSLATTFREPSVSSKLCVATSFEMLDTRSDVWTVIPLPDSFTNPPRPYPHPDYEFATALCGTDIFIVNPYIPILHIYSTISGVWRLVDYHQVNNIANIEPFHFSFAHCLFETQDACYFLASYGDYYGVYHRLPSLFSCLKVAGELPISSYPKNEAEIPIMFHKLPLDVQDLVQNWVPKMSRKIDNLVFFSTFSTPDPIKKINYTCFVTCDGRYGGGHREGYSSSFALKVCKFSSFENVGEDVEFEVQDILQYKLSFMTMLKPRHFLVA